MAVGKWRRTNNARMRLAKGNWNIDSATMKCALFLSTSNIGPTSTTYAALTNEHANANGYTTGGVSVDFAFSGTTTITRVFTGGNPSWTAAGGSLVFRYAVIYEVGGDVYEYCLLDTTPGNITIPDGLQFTIDSDGTPNAASTLAGMSTD